MAFGVHQKVSHDISSAFGKGLQGLKVETMANQRKQTRGFSGRAVVESIMLGIFTITMAAIPVVVTRVPAPESLIIIKEVLQDWCTPSICFVVLIVGVLIVSFGGGGSEPPSTPEQNHKKFADSYLTQGPVSATQIDPLRMPDIFFSADAARTRALNHSASFPARVAQPSSVMVPVYYPAFVPPQQSSPFSSHSEKDVEFMLRHDHRFESNMGERFSPRVDDRFVPRVEDRFSPRVDERFSPRVEERFVPRADERFSPKVDDRFVPRMEERFSPRVEERFVPKVDERYGPRVEERYVPQVEERYEARDQDRFEAEEEDIYEPAEVRYEAHVESRAISDSDDEGRYAPGEDAELDSEDEVESEQEPRYFESEADEEGEAEPEVEMQSESEDEVVHHSHESHVASGSVDARKVVSPPHSPMAPSAVEVVSLVHTQLPPSLRQGHNASSTAAPDAEVPSSFLSRRRPPTVPTPIGVQKAPPPLPGSEPVATSPLEPKVSPPEAKMSVRVERKEAPEMSPRTPPKHAHGRRPLSSSSSRSYAEFVRRTTNCPLSTPKVPSPPTRAKPESVALAPAGVLRTVGSGLKAEAVEPSLDEKLVKLKARRHSTGGSALMTQLSMPTRRPREVRVVDDDKLDDKELTQDAAEDDDVDQRVEAFLKNFREQMRLQRQESLQRHRRGDIAP